MNDMFNLCRALKELNLSNFNTNNVTNMNRMFYSCSFLKELNISNFNNKNVTDWGFMFGYCSKMKLKRKLEIKITILGKKCFIYFKLLLIKLIINFYKIKLINKYK